MKNLVTILLLIVLSLTGCNRRWERTDYRDMPPNFSFTLKKNGIKLDDKTLDNIKMYYLDNNWKRYVILKRAMLNEQDTQNVGALSAGEVSILSTTENIKDFYLEYQDETTDVLYINYRHLSKDEANNHNCNCYYPIEPLKFNNVVITSNLKINDNIIYNFDK